ncbi:MAG: hypothetical protein ACRDL7_00845, partial [Gaiellaceae bacterium]
MQSNPQVPTIQEHDGSDDSTAEFYAIKGRTTNVQEPTSAEINQMTLFVQLINEGRPSTIYKALLDTGASKSLVDVSLTHPETILKDKSKTVWTTRTGTYTTNKKARLRFHFLELNSKQQIDAVFHVDKVSQTTLPSHGYDMIIGRDLMEILGLDVNFQSRLISWGDFTIPMSSSSTVPSVTEAQAITTNNDDAELTPALQRALARQGTALTSSTYDKHNYIDMINKCSHLDQRQQNILLKLFKKYAELFSGRVGTFPGPPCHIDIKPGALPYSARPYTIPRAYESLVKEEIDRLVDIGVLKANVASAWGSPTFVIPKKDGRIRVITDFRVVNSRTERKPHPILLIPYIIHH